MNWAWTTSLDQLLHSQNIPMGLPLAAAGFFGFIMLIVLLRAQKSVANVALVVITLGLDRRRGRRDHARGRSGSGRRYPDRRR